MSELLMNAYLRQKNAKRLDTEGNPIEMKLSFTQWLAIWVDSGHLNNRGRGKGKYVMSRINDLGHYELGNVFIQLHTENVSQAKRGRQVSQVIRDRTSLSMKGKRHLVSQETKDKQSVALKNKPWSKARRDAQNKRKGEL